MLYGVKELRSIFISLFLLHSVYSDSCILMVDCGVLVFTWCALATVLRLSECLILLYVVVIFLSI